MAVDSTSFNNPFANPYVCQNDATRVFNPYAAMYGATTGLNDDFMAQATGIYSNSATGSQPVFKGGYNLSGQPAADTYQKSSGLFPATVLGLTAGGATTAGLYYLGGNKVNPYKDGKFDDQLLRSLEDPKTLENKIEELTKNKVNEILGSKNIDKHQYDAIKDFANTGTKPTTVSLPSELSGLTQEQAKTMVEELEKEINAIKPDDIAAQARRTSTLDGSVSYLNELNARKAKLTDLAKDISKENLAKHLQENAKLYGITGADDAAIKAAAEAEAKKGLSTLISENAGHITTQEAQVRSIRGALEGRILPHYDTAKNALREGAPESIAKVLKNYKLTKAGKWGLAAAGVGAVLGWLFGKS